MIEKDLKWIKKHYGEKMMHLCRKLFPKILQNEGSLSSILEKHFEHNRHLADDIINSETEADFAAYIMSFVDENSKIKEPKKNKSAVELMKEAGYVLYPECKTDRDIQAFRKWYEPNEAICTFFTDRLETCRVWFAVKENADEILRENFTNPERQDEYGTSVISIQFQKSLYGTLSIKNRYNHTVRCCDSTFDNNLDNIIPGLTLAFENDYGAVDRTFDYGKTVDFVLPNYVCVKGKYYNYNIAINGLYYCRNNIVLHKSGYDKLPEHRMLVDYFVFDLKNNTVELYDKTYEDSFIESLGIIKNIIFKENKFLIERECGEIVEVGINNDREIVSLKYNDLIVCGDGFLSGNKKICKLEMLNLTECGDLFLACNEDLKELQMPNLSRCGNSFLNMNRLLTEADFPLLERCGGGFLNRNRLIEKVDFSNLVSCGDGFMQECKGVEELSIPNLVNCGDSFFSRNEKIMKIYLPKLQECGNSFLSFNQTLEELDLPKLKKCGQDFLRNNKLLLKVNLPKLEECGDRFLLIDFNLKKLTLPELKVCGNSFLRYNDGLEEINIPNLAKAGMHFMYRNSKLEGLDAPRINSIGDYCLVRNVRARDDLFACLKSNKTLELEETKTIKDKTVSER